MFPEGDGDPHDLRVSSLDLKRLIQGVIEGPGRVGDAQAQRLVGAEPLVDEEDLFIGQNLPVGVGYRYEAHLREFPVKEL